MPVQPLDLQGGPVNDGNETRLAALAAFALLIFGVILYLLFKLNLIFDGALFSFVVLEPNGWSLFWSNYASRFDAYLIEWVAPHLFLRISNDQNGALLAHGFFWSALPVLCLLASFFMTRDPRSRCLFVWSAIWFVFFGFLALGFPTEAWIMQAVYWPTFIIALTATFSVWTNIAFLFLCLALAFSYDSSFLLAPVVALALAANAKVSFSRKLPAFAMLVIAFVVWIFVKFAFPPTNSDIAFMLNNGRKLFFSPSFFIQPVLLKIFGFILLIFLFNFLYDKLQRTILQKYRSQLYWTAVVLALVVISGVRLGNWELAPSSRYYSRTVISLLLPVFSLLPLLDWRRRLPADWKNGLWRRLQTAPFDLWRKRLVAIMVPVAIIQAVSATRMAVEFDKFTKYLAALSQLKAGTLSYEEAAAQSGLPASPTFKLFNGSWPLIYASMLSDTSLNPPTLIYDKRIDHFPFSCDRLDELTTVPQRQLLNIRAIYCDEPQRWR